MTETHPQPGSRYRRFLFAIVVVVAVGVVGFLVFGGSDDDAPTVVEGVVVDVEGDLRGIEGFDVLATDGTRYTLIPVAGLLFDDGAPLSHVQAHLVSGQPVSVRLERPTDGILRAVSIRDATR